MAVSQMRSVQFLCQALSQLCVFVSKSLIVLIMQVLPDFSAGVRASRYFASTVLVLWKNVSPRRLG